MNQHDRRMARRADGRLALISRRLETSKHPIPGEPYPANYWRHAYADDVATLIQVIDALAIQIRGSGVFDGDGKETT